MSKSTIVIIDDEEPVLHVLSKVLEREGYEVHTASSAASGIALARQYLPHLILCDVNMPGMDGKNVLDTLRQDPDLAATQFVLMTGNPDYLSPRQGMERGADDFLVKPFGSDELRSCVKARLRSAKVHWRVEDRIIKMLRADLDRTLPHEFLTPLSGIIGLASALRLDWRNYDPDEVDELLKSLEESGWRLERTVRKYLMILKMNSNPTEFSPSSEVMDTDLVHNIVIRESKKVAERWERSGDLQCDVAAVKIFADAEKLSIIVEELVDNAFAFSTTGRPVKVLLSPEGIFSVIDTGRGMSDAQLQQIKVFQQFERKHYEQQGLGLGLVLVKRIGALFGAKFDINSSSGEGTTVSVTFKTEPL